MMCIACQQGDHDWCGQQSWCECDCDGMYVPDGWCFVDDLDGGRLVKKDPPDKDRETVNRPWFLMSEKRCEHPPENCIQLRAMEFSFQTPVFVTTEQQRRLQSLLDEIVRQPWNQLEYGVHWLSEWGAKPHWREPHEPTFDDTVLAGSSCARGFVSAKERERVTKERACQDQ